MTVAELRQVLAQYPDDAPVAVELPVEEPFEPEAYEVCSHFASTTNVVVLVLGPTDCEIDPRF